MKLKFIQSPVCLGESVGLHINCLFTYHLPTLRQALSNFVNCNKESRDQNCSQPTEFSTNTCDNVTTNIKNSSPFVLFLIAAMSFSYLPLNYFLLAMVLITSHESFSAHLITLHLYLQYLINLLGKKNIEKLYTWA